MMLYEGTATEWVVPSLAPPPEPQTLDEMVVPEQVTLGDVATGDGDSTRSGASLSPDRGEMRRRTMATIRRLQKETSHG